MPIYEYRCTKCRKRFSVEQSITEYGKRRPACPKCKSRAVEQMLSTFFAKTGRKRTGRGPSACGVRAAARNRGEARSHGRANDQLGLQVLSLRKTFRVIFTPP